MKKYLLIGSFILMSSTLQASDRPLEDAQSSSPNRSLPLSAVEAASIQTTASLPSLDAQRVLADFRTNPQNFASTGGIMGFFAQQAPTMQAVEALFQTFDRYYSDLRRQLEVANAALQETDAVRRALAEVQLQRERLDTANKILEEEVTAAKSRASLLKAKEETLLLEASKQSAALALEQARKNF